MKIEPFKCPNCGAMIDPPKSTSDFYCTYCGYKLHMNDEIQRSEIIHVIRDEAKLKELEYNKEFNSKIINRPLLIKWIIFITTFLIYLLCCYIIRHNKDLIIIALYLPAFVLIWLPVLHSKHSGLPTYIRVLLGIAGYFIIVFLGLHIMQL